MSNDNLTILDWRENPANCKGTSLMINYDWNTVLRTASG